jgi:hypothetical protein
MRFQAYLFASCLALVSSSAFVGCGSNESLGSGLPEDAGGGGTAGASAVTTVTGASTASGGATTGGGGTSAVASSSAGTSAVAGQISGSSSAAAGSSVIAGTTATGGASTGTTTGAAGTTGVAGKTASGGTATGGTRTGGTTTTSVSTGGMGGGAGTNGISTSPSGVILTASLAQPGTIQGIWQNNTQSSIFLYGCGTADAYQKQDTGWVNIGKPMACSWEGASPEVKPGASYTDPSYGPINKYWGGNGGIFRLTGKYGVGCTNPSAGQSKAGCTAFYEVTSNEIEAKGPPTATDADAGVDADCGTMPEGVTCKKPTGGCAIMTCTNGSWACAAGQTRVALVPGACDVTDAGSVN